MPSCASPSSEPPDPTSSTSSSPLAMSTQSLSLLNTSRSSSPASVDGDPNGTGPGDAKGDGIGMGPGEANGDGSGDAPPPLVNDDATGEEPCAPARGTAGGPMPRKGLLIKGFTSPRPFESPTSGSASALTSHLTSAFSSASTSCFVSSLHRTLDATFLATCSPKEASDFMSSSELLASSDLTSDLERLNSPSSSSSLPCSLAFLFDIRSGTTPIASLCFSSTENASPNFAIVEDNTKASSVWQWHASTVPTCQDWPNKKRSSPCPNHSVK
mmetsp:Transcript_8460/g.24257  ORF Transcript_8460/g.24257 Transcript_8460/m.24257 type:complete len:271 (+) Transcript_8460:656-1468(+)